MSENQFEEFVKRMAEQLGVTVDPEATLDVTTTDILARMHSHMIYHNELKGRETAYKKAEALVEFIERWDTVGIDRMYFRACEVLGQGARGVEANATMEQKIDKIFRANNIKPKRLKVTLKERRDSIAWVYLGNEHRIYTVRHVVNTGIVQMKPQETAMFDVFIHPGLTDILLLKVKDDGTPDKKD